MQRDTYTHAEKKEAGDKKRKEKNKSKTEEGI
jgi:hypothetical protein